MKQVTTSNQIMEPSVGNIGLLLDGQRGIGIPAAGSSRGIILPKPLFAQVNVVPPLTSLS